VDIVCTHCWHNGVEEPEISIEEDDTLARCERCGRRYRIFTGDLARSTDGKPINALRSSYVLHLAPSERLPQRWRISAPSDTHFERGYRYTLVWHQGRLTGIADQTSSEWIPVTHAWADDARWRAAWIAVTVFVVANLLLQIRALRTFLDQGIVWWAGPAIVALALAVMAIRWLLSPERS
jgi:hypothetical protein